MNEDPQELPQSESTEPIALIEFFETTPPGNSVPVKNILQRYQGFHRPESLQLLIPELRLFCTSETCNGVRVFSCEDSAPNLYPNKLNLEFIQYSCRNCRNSMKVFAISIHVEEGTADGIMMKLGELPPFGPPTPAKVISLIGPDREYFLKGRRAENQGLGIGAFAYYRRVVENQKNRILEKIIRVSERIGASQETIVDLKTAMSEIQFSKAVASIKHGIPQVLLINGHNPLTLLHSALSEGLHAQSDAQCLELATSIRVVLSDLAERLSQALKDEVELNTAVTRLLQASSQKQLESKKNE
jgi:hypothetical protein